MTEAESGRPALAGRARFGQGKTRRGRQALVRPAPAPWPATDTPAGARPSVIAVKAGLSFGRRAGRAPRGSKARARCRQGRLDESRRRRWSSAHRAWSGHAWPRAPRARRRTDSQTNATRTIPSRSSRDRGERLGRVAWAVVGRTRRAAAPRRPQRPADALRHPETPCRFSSGNGPPQATREASSTQRRAFPAGPLAATGPGAGDSAPGPVEANGVLDAGTGHAARAVMPTATGGAIQLQLLEPEQAGAPEDPDGRGRRDAGRLGDVGAGQAMAPQGDGPPSDMPWRGPARPARPR